MALAQPFILLYWIVRAACYVSGRHLLVAVTSSINLLAVLLGIAVTYRLNLLSPAAGFVILAAGAVVPSIIGIRRLSSIATGATPDYSWREGHWKYGKWIFAASIAHNASTFYIPVLSAWLGLSQAGVFRANQLLLAPLLQLFAAAQSLLLPWLSSRNASKGNQYVQRLTGRLLLIPFIIGAIYSAALLLFGSSLSRFAFNNAEYENAVWSLQYFAVGTTIAVGGQCVSLIVRILGRPQAILVSKVLTASGFIVIGLPLIHAWGLRGALMTFVVLAVIETATLTIAALLWTRPTEPVAAGR
jgi:O-antigen/teichoic acid export membrane protein